MADRLKNIMGIIDPERTGTIEDVADGVAMVHSFANVGLVYGGGSILVVDTSSAMMADRAIELMRNKTSDRLQSIVYTHGHVDHAGGTPAFMDDAKSRGEERPDIWGHENVLRRF